MITGYVSAYPASFSRVKTKKDLKQAVAEFNQGQGDIDFQVAHPEMNGLINLKSFFEMNPQASLSFTNHPKRSWFATVIHDDGKVKVQ